MSILQNHTPHEIVIYKDGQPIASFPPAQPILRLTQEQKRNEQEIIVGRTSVLVVAPPKYMGLSDVVRGDILVSQLVAQWLVDHPDVLKFHGIQSVYVPDTGPGAAVRNEKGEIIGTTQLIKYV